MFGSSSPQEPAPDARRAARKRANLEFDFAGLGGTRRRNTRAPHKRPPAAEPGPTSTAATAQSTQPSEPVDHSPIAPTAPAEPEAAEVSEVLFIPAPPRQRNPEETMAQPNPTPITAGRSIDRQVKEQKAIHSLLHGAGLALICCILIFAGLASLGGYVLYRQIQDQSTTLALLERNTKQRMFEMEMDLIKRDNDLAKNLEQSNLRVTALTTQFEEYRYQTTQTLAELRARNRELEKQLSISQRKLSDQQSIIARLR